ncbi:MAG: enterochelin esterase [Myxococcales bacterium FL481]|nr:MAG: enterochelin esterase [Myxococcales bacterium FL481]
MPIHCFDPLRGRVEIVLVDSPALEHNLVDDPSTRQVAVYLPEGYDDTSADYPVFIDLAGFTGSGLKHLSWQAFGESLPQRIDRLVSRGQMGPVVLVMPDAFTSLGGNQYIDSVALGRWEGFMFDDMLPAIEQRYRVRRGRDHRAVFGRSSGGYGALIYGMRHADKIAAVACHSGDMHFDLLYRGDFARTLDVLARHERRIDKFLAHLAQTPKLSGDEFHALLILAMAATYDPDPHSPAGIRLPFDVQTAVLDPAAWLRWLAHDPLTLVEQAPVQAHLRSLRTLFIDCGSQDQYALHYGARALTRRLEALDIPHRYEEFPDNHSGIDYRLDHSLPALYQAVT